MLSLINNVIDRCFFTATFIIGVQLPEFMQQYQQRLAGHLTEAQLQLAQYTNIAQQHFDGSLSAMISRYKSNSDAAIVSTGELIANLSARVQYLSQHLEQITTNSYLQSVYQFIRHLDPQIAAGTAQQFAMAIPIELNAIATGAVLAISSLVLKTLSIKSVQRLFKAKRTPITHSGS
ncbi:Protein of unknown function [Colwellia chukchiensis]|uniref:DUF2937 domain-containing protein n=1 Tax=Colwellia chukchiensis TaxID=641665 RepID=A0A1H7QGU0_9GAMM|nr:DUF2937 family protein [Colwellia chukchiensis]SEL46765.1 Protein of unknown function [Colwellia chukchiensis]